MPTARIILDVNVTVKNASVADILAGRMKCAVFKESHQVESVKVEVKEITNV